MFACLIACVAQACANYRFQSIVRQFILSPNSFRRQNNYNYVVLKSMRQQKQPSCRIKISECHNKKVFFDEIYSDRSNKQNVKIPIRIRFDSNKK